MLGDAKLTLRQMVEEVKRQIGPEGRKEEISVIAREIKTRKEEWLKSGCRN